MAKFEIVSKYADAGLELPVRKTAQSAGYDMAAAEDYVIPSVWQMFNEAREIWPVKDDEFVTLEQMAEFTKQTGCKPTLISTGMKCFLNPDSWLQLSMRSSSPLKYWLMMANGIGVIDADYYDNQDNEGEIFFQIYNLSPFNIQIKKGETIGQGVVLPFRTTFDDALAPKPMARAGGFGSTDNTPPPPPPLPDYLKYSDSEPVLLGDFPDTPETKQAALDAFNESISS